MSLKHINAKEAKRLADSGAVLVDVRESREFAHETIPGATNRPLSRMGHGPLDVEASQIVFYCKSGGRTHMAANALARSTRSEVFILDGGIEAWKAAGLPVERS